MPRVQVCIQEIMCSYLVIFIDRATQKGIGPILRFRSDELVYTMLRRARANLETMNIVEMNLTQRRPVRINLDLTDEQYVKLKAQSSK